jgi:DHA2 family multidrug resistance protein
LLRSLRAFAESSRFCRRLRPVYAAFTGAALAQAPDQAVQWIGAQVQTQASFLSYVDAFRVLMLIALSAVPLALTLRNVKLGSAVSIGH